MQTTGTALVVLTCAAASVRVLCPAVLLADG